MGRTPYVFSSFLLSGSLLPFWLPPSTRHNLRLRFPRNFSAHYPSFLSLPSVHPTDVFTFQYVFIPSIALKLHSWRQVC